METRLFTVALLAAVCVYPQSVTRGYVTDGTVRKIDFPPALVDSLNEFSLTFTLRTDGNCETITNASNVIRWVGFGIGCTDAAWARLALWPGVSGYGPVVLASSTTPSTTYRFLLQRTRSTVEARVFKVDGTVVATKKMTVPLWTRYTGLLDIIKGGSVGVGQVGNIFGDLCWYPFRVAADINSATPPPDNQCAAGAIGKWLFEGNLADSAGIHGLHFSTVGVAPQYASLDTSGGSGSTPSSDPAAGSDTGYVTDLTVRKLTFPETLINQLDNFTLTFTMRTDASCETVGNWANVIRWVGFGIGCMDAGWRKLSLWNGVTGHGPVPFAENLAANTYYRFLLQRGARTLEARVFTLDGKPVATKSMYTAEWTRLTGVQEVIRGGSAGVGQIGNSFHDMCWYPVKLVPDIYTAVMPPATCDSRAIGKWTFDGSLAESAGVHNLNFTTSGTIPKFVATPLPSTPTPIVATSTSPVTVAPVVSDAILYNPGMGFSAFHIGPNAQPPFSQYPTPRVAYHRWYWYELEPSPGQYNFRLVDDTIAQARANNQDLAFRIMPSMPDWVKAQGVGQAGTGPDGLPDHNNPLFLSYHERLVAAFGARYGKSLDVDHVDIGSIGCWGEGNMACCPAGMQATCKSYMPTDVNARAISAWYYRYFPNMRLVALADLTKHAATLNAGWRGDCFGDYGMFSAYWNHMVTIYPPVVQRPEVINAWRKAPAQFEACGVMQNWYDRGFNIDLILQKGLEWHMSVFNGKNAPVPAAWRPKVDAFLKKMGYRFVLKSLTHTNNIAPGSPISITATWENRGVAPAYRRWPIAFRLRDAAGNIVAQGTSQADVRDWLPGTATVQDTFTIPASVPAGDYALDVAILRENGAFAYVEIAIAGKRTDLWYPVSKVRIAGLIQ